MKDGFVKVAAATPDLRVADCVYNAQKTIELIEQAQKAGVHLVVFPELGLTGYTCGDLFLQPTLLQGARNALEQVCQATAALTPVIVCGLPLVHRNKLYNCAAVIHKGEILGFVPKTHLPNYGEFYEQRWFSPAPDQYDYFTDGFCDTVSFGAKQIFVCEEMPEFCFAAEICEDLWALDPPSRQHAQAGARLIVNLSASNELMGKTAYRRSLVAGQSSRLVCGYLYANAGEGESTTDTVFSAHNLIAENGTIVAESCFTSGLLIAELDLQKLSNERRQLTTWPSQVSEGYLHSYFSMELTQTALSHPIERMPFVPALDAAGEERCEEILQIQSIGLKRRISHSHAKTAVIGISGGLDSALALLVCVRAFDLLGHPRTQIEAITMPCFGTTARTKGNAELLCECLGVSLRQIDIKAAVDLHFQDIGHDPNLRDVTYENAQARERTQVLMDISNQTNGLVVGTGDLSELALGWATYNGDHMSMYAVNAAVSKTLVRHLVAYEARHTKDESLRQVLLDILDTPVSPELLPPSEGEIQQKTEDLVGPYVLHDFFLYYAIRWGFTPQKILRLALIAFDGEYSREVLLFWLRNFYRRFFSQQFKRSCMPDGPKIGSISLSPRADWRMPSDAAANLWLSQLDALEQS